MSEFKGEITIPFEDFPDGVLSNIWYSNSKAKIWVRVRPKDDCLWYEVEVMGNEHLFPYRIKFYSFSSALRFANDTSSS